MSNRLEKLAGFQSAILSESFVNRSLEEDILRRRSCTMRQLYDSNSNTNDIYACGD